MINKIGQFLFLFTAFMPVTVFGTDLESIDGIWQDEVRKSHYYSIHQNDDTVVMINLKALEFDGDTLAATYVGSKDDLLLTPMASRQDLSTIPEGLVNKLPVILDFISDEKLAVNTQCDLCGVVPINLIKVFK